MDQAGISIDINTHEFDIAFSFPGEYREYVEDVVYALFSHIKPEKIFYDKFYKAHLAVPSLDTLLLDIYENRSKLNVVFLCEAYQEKQWCGLESRAIRNLIMQKQYERIMLIRTDDGKVDGYFDTDGGIDARQHKPEEMADNIVQRLTRKLVIPVPSNVAADSTSTSHTEGLYLERKATKPTGSAFWWRNRLRELFTFTIIGLCVAGLIGFGIWGLNLFGGMNPANLGAGGSMADQNPTTNPDNADTSDSATDGTSDQTSTTNPANADTSDSTTDGVTHHDPTTNPAVFDTNNSITDNPLPLGPEDSSATSVVYGNTAGNIINRGISAQNDGWIYFASGGEEKWLYKAHLDGSGVERLTDDDPKFINVVGGWVYYSNWSDWGHLYRIRIDGTDREKVVNERAYYIQRADNWIYYINKYYMYDDMPTHLYKIRPDGSGRTRIIDDNVNEFNVVGNWVYYIHKTEGVIYRVKTDGTGQTKLNSSFAEGTYDWNTTCLVVDGEWLYHCSENGLYKMRTDGMEETLISDDVKDSRINVDGEWIYYISPYGEAGLSRIRIDGSNNSKLCGDETWDISIADGWIYYMNTSGDQVYMIKTDGSQQQKLKDFIKTTGKYEYANGVDTYEGDLMFGLPNGIGTVTYGNGSKYFGEVKDGKRHGIGAMGYDNGHYDGEWANDEKNGKGKYSWTSGRNSGDTYDGEWANDAWSGQGIYSYGNSEYAGDTYEGGSVGGVRSGYGVYTSAMGWVYEGEYQNGEWHGQGKYTYPNKDVYEGGFQNGMFHGEGKYTNYETGAVFEARWEESKIVEW